MMKMCYQEDSRKARKPWKKQRARKPVKNPTPMILKVSKNVDHRDLFFFKEDIVNDGNKFHIDSGLLINIDDFGRLDKFESF